MTPIPERITPQLVRNLELAADMAFDLLARDIQRVKNGIYDYPTAALVLDETGTVRLGAGVSTDIRSGNPGAHAEVNALEDSRLNSSRFGPRITPRILVSTLESCLKICYPEVTRQIGRDGLIGYVMKRSDSEALEHVNARQTTDDTSMEGVRSLYLQHPRLQAKGKFLFEEFVVSRDIETGLTTVDESVIPHIPREFAQIGARHPFEPVVNS